jgi:nitrite transporter NirC
MFSVEFQSVAAAGEKKSSYFSKRPWGYLILSMLAGVFISLGSFVSMSIGGVLTSSGFTATKVVVAASFAAALSLVVMAGSELFTGNNFVLGSAALTGRIKWSRVILLWAACYLGNLVGSWIMVLLFHFSGCAGGSAGEYFATVSAAKTSAQWYQLIIRGVLCNICVCCAVWCSFKMKSESGKLIMIFWCIFIFMVCGFEHSIANMSIIGVSLLGGSVTVGGYIYNLVFVTVGNIIGGTVFVAVPYFIAAGRE